MGKGDNRASLKMRQRRRQAKLKQRIKNAGKVRKAERAAKR